MGVWLYLEALQQRGLSLDEVAVQEVQRRQVVQRLAGLGVLDAQVLAAEAKALHVNSQQSTATVNGKSWKPGG